MIPAAAVTVGSTVTARAPLPDGTVEDWTVTVRRIHNATPRVGRITWETDKGPLEIGGAVPVTVLPE